MSWLPKFWPARQKNNFVIRGLRTPASDWGGRRAQVHPPPPAHPAPHTWLVCPPPSHTGRREGLWSSTLFPFSPSHHLPLSNSWPGPHLLLASLDSSFPQRVGRSAALSMLYIWFHQSVYENPNYILAFLYNLWYFFSLFWKMVTLLTCHDDSMYVNKCFYKLFGEIWDKLLAAYVLLEK